jgi:exodeoxyribonuclease V alpha subunit
MKKSLSKRTGIIEETINGIVERVTYHNPENGWTILRVLPFNIMHQQETVIVHQTKVFAGATMEFKGSWTYHKKYGSQLRQLRQSRKNLQQPQPWKSILDLD